MKSLALSFVTFVSLNASAISFITEADVQQALGADKVIEISKYVAQERLLEAGTDCARAADSRSGRAYVVSVGGDAQLYVTSDNLAGLQACGSLGR